MRASNDRKAIPAFGMLSYTHVRYLGSFMLLVVLMNALWSIFALLTVVLAPHRATSALLMTGINHSVFATGMALTAGVGIREMFGLEVGVTAKRA